MPHCTKCGAMVEDNAGFCPTCDGSLGRVLIRLRSLSFAATLGFDPVDCLHDKSLPRGAFPSAGRSRSRGQNLREILGHLQSKGACNTVFLIPVLHPSLLTSQWGGPSFIDFPRGG